MKLKLLKLKVMRWWYKYYHCRYFGHGPFIKLRTMDTKICAICNRELEYNLKGRQPLVRYQR